MTHCTSTIVAFRFVCSAGNATFTTVPSMKAMLDARVVAARTQCPASFEQGAVAGRERIMLSSHGSWRTGNIRRFLTRFFGRSRVWNVHRDSQRILLRATGGLGLPQPYLGRILEIGNNQKPLRRGRGFIPTCEHLQWTDRLNNTCSIGICLENRQRL